MDEPSPPADPLQLFCKNPGLPTDGKSYPVIDKHGRCVGRATAAGGLVAIELADQDMAKRLCMRRAEISMGYTVKGQPIEVREVGDD